MKRLRSILSWLTFSPYQEPPEGPKVAQSRTEALHEASQRFWKDHNESMKNDPEYRRVFEEETRAIREYDERQQ